ncbi:hypothetical protein AB0G15_05535 [Streptosporangium sp. NPDC023825]|uniref:hypothetical protein n=1 Tax=Streptosporangium sp. NPDC023825 TaxID=3154909 RepID=UPI0034337BA7
MRTLTRHVNQARKPAAAPLDDATQQALEHLAAKGFRLPDRPAGERPTLPADVTELSDEELMSLYAQTVAWTQYAAGQCAIAEVAERTAEDRLEEAKAAAIVTGSGKTATALKASAADNPAVIAARQKHAETYALRKLMAVVASAAENDTKFLSRDLTRRTGISDQTRRNNKWNT